MPAGKKSNVKKHDGQNVGHRLEQALKAFGYWPTEELWTAESVREWIADELEEMTTLHLHAIMMVVTGLRVLELEEEAGSEEV